MQPLPNVCVLFCSANNALFVLADRNWEATTMQATLMLSTILKLYS